MALRVFVNGEDVGEAKNFRIFPGEQRFTRVNSLGGGSDLIPGLREPDRFQFESDAWVDIGGTLEVRDENGARRLMADRVKASSSGGSLVTGFVQG